MIKYSTYHAHTTYCDGKNTAEEMILAAIEKKCPEIGISGHSPLPVGQWCMKESKLGDYIQELSDLRDKYSSSINVFIGMEQDLDSKLFSLPFDYIIGSAHAVFVGDKRIDVDANVDFVRSAISEGFGGDPYAYCEEYYRRVEEVYNTTHCDIIGHFDLITKFIEVDPLFSISDARYVKAVDRALDALFESPAVFEVNTGAISRGYRTTPYPDRYILDRLKAAGKPVVVNSDSHRADTVDFLIDETAQKLTSYGIKCISSLSELLEYSRGGKR